MIEQHEVEWNKEKIARYWDVFGNINPVTPWFSVKSRDWLLKEILKISKDMVTPKAKLRILDMGSGSGEFINFIKLKTDFECYGIDLSEERIKIAKKDFSGVKFDIGSLSKTNFEDGFFDIIVSTQTIEHLMDEDLKPSFDEMYRILNVGGKALITTRFEEDLSVKKKVCPDCLAIFKHSQHLQSFSMNSIQELLESSKLKANKLQRSRCRLDFYGVIPKFQWISKFAFVNRFLFLIFGNYLDNRLGIYLYALAEKKSM